MGPLVVAHRGSSAQHADNSWAGFAAAATEGADVIECDVQASRDGILLIRHDLRLDDRLVADLAWADLARRDPGLIKLCDLLAWAARAPIDLLVEVKEPSATAGVARAIVMSGWDDHCVLGSFHGPSLADAKAVAPRLRTSFMIGSVVRTEELARLAAAYHADGVHLCWEARAARPHELLDRDAVARLHRAGLAVTLWHEERPEELRALVGLAPDAICTNTPAALRHIVEETTRAARVIDATEETP